MENNIENLVSNKIASPWKRFLSFSIDSFIILPIYFGLYFLINFLDLNFGINHDLILKSFYNVVFLMFLLITWISFKGQSPGQMIMKLKIVTIDDKELSVLQYFLRLIGWLASNMTFGIGFLVMFFNKDLRCLHDFTSNAKVIDLK